MENHVCVLMSSYNGERFIREQIDSILRQKDVSIQLVIRDDGSTDNTREIIKEYSRQYNSVNVILGENIGVGNSFMTLLYNAPEADYYAFSDQDDIWQEDKLSRAIIKISEVNSKETIPILYASNQTLIDAQGNTIGMRYKHLPNCNLFDCIACNSIAGCTMVMNKIMREGLISKEHVPNEEIIRIRIHDTWCMMAGHIIGKVIVDQESRILYRQHENNVVGAEEKRGISLIQDKWKRLTGAKYKGIRSCCAKELQRCFSEQLTDEERKGLSIIEEANSFRGGIRLIRNKEIRSSFRENTIVLLIKAFMGWI